jgi:hypothetical protein
MESVYSNFNHELNEVVKQQAMDNPGLEVDHPAWNFHGTIKYKDGKWHEIVRVHHSIQATWSDENLEELIERVNQTFGWD